MSNKSKSPFSALPGWIITKPYIPTDATFVSANETSGDAQKSEVLEVGEAYRDDNGNIREPLVKPGDIVLHFYAQQTYEVGFDKFRAVHFSQIIGILK